jgi:hypothetical protein
VAAFYILGNKFIHVAFVEIDVVSLASFLFPAVRQ